jgi:hypothetical protein
MGPMPAPSVPHVSLERQQRKAQLATLGWALRRAALGLAILLIVAVLSAWLLYASIEPDGMSSGPGSHSEYALPQG